MRLHSSILKFAFATQSSATSIHATAVVPPSQHFLVLFGAPGVGKGTFAKMIKTEFGYNHISTGDEIRKILKGQTSEDFDKKLITSIKDIVNSGGLVGDEVVMKILQEKMKEKDSQKGVILDGFPRTLNQLVMYQRLFPISLVINFTLRQDILLEKLMGRRTCVGCGNSYNICDINKDGYVMEPLPPKVKDVCDTCKSKLEIRHDDSEEIISTRMQEYEQKTKPLLLKYKEQGVLVDFEVKKGKKDYPRLQEVLKKHLK